MKLAVLTDVHGNLPALEAVSEDLDAWRPDCVVVGGDIVNRGPRSRECLAAIQRRVETDHWVVTRGNHEEYVLKWMAPAESMTKRERELFGLARWTHSQLTPPQLAWLSALPSEHRLAIRSAADVVITHGSASGIADGIFPWFTARDLVGRVADQCGLFIVGHTHSPFVTRLDATDIVNVGSVGLPFDSDPRASYGRFTNLRGAWRAEIVRVPYDRVRAERDFDDSGFLAGCGPLALLVRDELRSASSRLFQWLQVYEAPLADGRIGIADAVHEYLASLARPTNP
ncbi:MAG: metallophosphoesterase family protein [Planctomycetota bacterium]